MESEQTIAAAASVPSSTATTAFAGEWRERWGKWEHDNMTVDVKAKVKERKTETITPYPPYPLKKREKVASHDN